MNKSFDSIEERRKQRRLDRLGSRSPACVICGERDDRCLEAHHVAGQRLDEGTVPVCRNCHRKLSDRQKGHPVQQTQTLVIEEVVAHFLLGMADLFELLVQKLRDFAEKLIAVDSEIISTPGGQDHG